MGCPGISYTFSFQEFTFVTKNELEFYQNRIEVIALN